MSGLSLSLSDSAVKNYFRLGAGQQHRRGNYIHDFRFSCGSPAYLSGSTLTPLGHVIEPRTNPGPVQNHLGGGNIAIKNTAAGA